MYSKYYLDANELDNQFIESIKTLFKDKKIEILIHDNDETDYLLSSKKNRKALLKAIKNVNKNKHLIETNFSNLH